MTQLIPLVQSESLNCQAVNARELHEFLIMGAKGGQKGRKFADWIKEKIEFLDLIEGVDYVKVEFDYLGNPVPKNGKSENQTVRKTNKVEYIVKMDIAKEISMIQNNDKGREARRYFIECEKQLKATVKPKTRLELAHENLQLIIEAEEREALLLEAKPKVDKYDKFMKADTLQTSTQVANVLGVTAIALNRHLESLGVFDKRVKRTRIFAKWFLQAGYGETKETQDGYTQAKFTPAGVNWIFDNSEVVKE